MEKGKTVKNKIFEHLKASVDFNTYKQIKKLLGEENYHPERVRRAIKRLIEDGVLKKYITIYGTKYQITYELANQLLDNESIIVALYAYPAFEVLMEQRHPHLDKGEIKGIYELAIACFLEALEHIPLIIPLKKPNVD